MRDARCSVVWIWGDPEGFYLLLALCELAFPWGLQLASRGAVKLTACLETKLETAGAERAPEVALGWHRARGCPGSCATTGLLRGAARRGPGPGLAS